jgi:hypothetical protein
MSEEGLAWGTFDAAMRSYVSEFAALSAAAKPEVLTYPRWVRRNDRYVREERPKYSTAQRVNNSAFFLESFRALEAAFYASPLKPYLPGGPATQGPGPAIAIHPRDASIRIAFGAAKFRADGQPFFDQGSMESAIQSLHYLVEAKTLTMELIGILIGVQVLETIHLRENLRVETLPESEIESFLAQLPFPMSVDLATQEWEVLVPAPITVLRLTYEQPRDHAMEDHSSELIDDNERFADAVALYHDARPVLFFHRLWLSDRFLRNSWSTSNPTGTASVDQSVLVTETGGVIEACSALRRLASTDTENSVRLAIRRLGLTRSRALSDDVLIDVMIALEALLLTKDENDELSFRMSLRASQWAAMIGEKSSIAFDLVRCAYGLRSTIVHGGSPKSSKMYNISGSDIDYNGVVSSVAAMARKFGIDALKRVLNGGFDMRWNLRLKAFVDGLSVDRF